MIKFLFKGLLRDRHRSLFPIIVVALGVLLTTLLYSFMSGMMNDLIDSTARFDSGHLKVMTASYHELENQLPNDLALTSVESLLSTLKKTYPDYEWTPRIKFAGLLDVPDENGETKSQSPVFGIAADLFNKNSHEAERLNLMKALLRGRIPDKPGEVLLSDSFAKKLGVGLNHKITLLSTTSGGAMAVQNFVVSGTVAFGITAMDKGAMIADLSDIQFALEMPDGAGEILGYSRNKFYESEQAGNIAGDFNQKFSKPSDKFSPLMLTLEDQNGMREYIKYADSMGLIIVGIFLIAMSAVLLNAGLMSGIRRYGEVGVRLALGERKGHIYKTLIYESILIGLTGSFIGTFIGLLIAYYFQQAGFDISGSLRNSSIMMSNVLRARISPASFYIGFVPGLIATTLGTALSGIQIFKRQTAQLFKELEA
ncbi:MAG: ABC transporter permease [Ignavibacteria bacterium]|jgi:putative ABC transport system permease protein|nr:ABC transporter permease [Ignavibacteria bacterium]MCU7500087.1 ABC transporter permease [Ignavibacteria bacterium]